MGHFYFVRHGQTVWNVENKICGATDSPLTEHGRQQAAETGKNIVESGIKADEILYSPLSRAADTAKIISEMSGIPCREEPRLIENGSLRRETAKSLRWRKRHLPADMKGENPCCSLHSVSIICWMR